MELTKTTIHTNRIKDFYKTREEDDFDLVNGVRYLLSLIKDESIVNTFLNHPDIQEIKDRKPDVQMFILNKYFTNILLKYRGIGGAPVTGALQCFTIATTPEKWYAMFVDIVLPLIEHGYVYESIREGKLWKKSKPL